jgi:alkylation response protein AidB-like acyl-CoA dehydrogenase
MEFTFSDEQQMLRDTARRFLDDKAPMEHVRALMESETGFDESQWTEIAAQGWQAMAIPERYGGAGFSFMEQATLMEEMGKSLFPAPFLSSIVLGADLVLHAGNEDQKAALLPEVAAGERRLAVAHLEDRTGWDPGAISMVAEPDGDTYRLSGEKLNVVDGHTAHTLLVLARQPGTVGADGVSVFVVDAEASGIDREWVETLDQTRKQARVGFDGVEVNGALGEPGTGVARLSETLARAAVALAFEQVGGAQRCLDMSVGYAKERVQFGRPIGSFQAIKHMCADMLVAVESARSAAYYAGWVVSSDPSDLAVASPLAKSVCSEAYSRCAGDTIQIHGGVGFTWEHDAHLYFKRAKSSELLFGSPSDHRARLAATLGV